MHHLTRREFTFATASIVTLAAAGCDSQADQGNNQTEPSAAANNETKDEGKEKKPKLATEPFLIGPISGYRQPGVYAQHRDTQGVFVVSDGKTITALSGVCTHLACMTKLDQDRQIFYCPCHKSTFDYNGIQQDGAKAKRPLERCALSLVPTDSGRQIQVDPTRRFRKDKDQWSDPASELKIS